MQDLHTRFVAYIKRLYMNPQFKQCQIYLSGHLDPGEGETKIFGFIVKNIDPTENVVVYGEDCDLYFYALVNKFFNLTIINQRESLELIRIKVIHEFFIWNFSQLTSRTGFNIDRIIRDVTFVFLMNGNDYVPSLPGFETNPGSMYRLFDLYSDHLSSFDELTDAYLTEDKGLHLKNLEMFFARIKSLEACLGRTKKINELKGTFYQSILRVDKKELKRLSASYLKILHWNIQVGD